MYYKSSLKAKGRFNQDFSNFPELLLFGKHIASIHVSILVRIAEKIHNDVLSSKQGEFSLPEEFGLRFLLFNEKTSGPQKWIARPRKYSTDDSVISFLIEFKCLFSVDTLRILATGFCYQTSQLSSKFSCSSSLFRLITWCLSE